MIEPISGANAFNTSGPCRESSETIIRRRLTENQGRAEMYAWLINQINARPLTKDAEEALWSMLVRERPY